MDSTVKNFLHVGRRFRSLHTRGDILIIESDIIMREFIKRWALSVGVNVVETANIKEAMTFLENNKFRCVVLGLGWQNLAHAEKLLKKVDKESPATVSVVYSSYLGKISYLQNEIPRITTIHKGVGFEELIFSINAEMHPEGVVA